VAVGIRTLTLLVDLQPLAQSITHASCPLRGAFVFVFRKRIGHELFAAAHGADGDVELVGRRQELHQHLLRMVVQEEPGDDVMREFHNGP
jgi:hypothetical protein